MQYRQGNPADQAGDSHLPEQVPVQVQNSEQVSHPNGLVPACHRGITTSVQVKFRSVSSQPIVTQDRELEKIFNVIEKVSQTNATVLILGESGTGKEVFAKLIHESSNSSGAFVPVNCAAIPDSLLESELFGYEKGAFTGATQSKVGRFQLAENGTIFLDEIGEMSPHLQVKLLRVLQERIVEPVGGIKPRSVNVRVIAATNVNLREKVKAGSFREDLYYRLHVVPVELPPLRERKDDITMLAGYFSEIFAERYNVNKLVLSPEVEELFQCYSWPGNVRELQNLMERLSILVDTPEVTLEHVPEHILNEQKIGLNERVCMRLPEGGVDFNMVVDSFESSLITQALTRTGGNKKAAAELLGLNRTTLVEKIKKRKLAQAIEETDDDNYSPSNHIANNDASYYEGKPVV